MRITELSTIQYATDLSAFAECSHRTVLDYAVARGILKRPGRNEIEQELLQKRGHEHEKRVLAHFVESGRRVHTVGAHPRDAEGAAAETLEAMRRGEDVIYQGTLVQSGWVGRPDFLIKVDDGYYEPIDAKLARAEKAAAILQLCGYVSALGAVQAREPEHFHLALGTEPLQLTKSRASEYMAYYRRAKAQFDEFVGELARGEGDGQGDGQGDRQGNGEGDGQGLADRLEADAFDGGLPYPEPVAHCDVCSWWKRCDERRRKDDHLSLVAGITRRQREHLADHGTSQVVTLAALAPSARVEGIEPGPLTRIREQARLQVEGRKEQRTKHELLTEFDPGMGLEALPMPSPGDLFFDLEGDAFYETTGLEYLFGLVELGQTGLDGFTERTEPGPPNYLSYWATNREKEKAAFEAIIDRIQTGRLELPELHVYHFGHREADAVRRLSCLHKTREDAVDELLRQHVFVDLHRVVRQALRASVESYSLKRLEPLYDFTRKTDLRDAARAMQLFGRFLELGGSDGCDETRAIIATYNEEDCLSTWKLREFLEAQRPELERALGRSLDRPSAATHDDDAGKKRADQDRVLRDVVADLTRGLPKEAAQDSDDDGARRLLSVLLDYHWREAKSGWWEYFRTAELAPSERLEDSAALDGLRFEGVVGKVKLSPVYRYTFPRQRHSIRMGRAKDPDSHENPNRFKTVDVVAIGDQYVDIKRGKGRESEHPSALIPGGPVNTDALKDSLIEFGRTVVAAGDGDVGSAAWDLLRRHPPRLKGGKASSGALQRAGEDDEQALLRVVPLLDGSVVSMQGPPGSGKTYLAAQLIRHLTRQGQRVGVTANSHAVIRNLLEKAVEIEAVPAEKVAHYRSSDDAGEDDGPGFVHCKNYKELSSALDRGTVVVVGGTAWAWANDALQGSVDTLIVDEAGQMSLANVIAACRGTRNLVLVGDPAQLNQPSKGVHPEGTQRSALGHVLQDAGTMPEHLGLFLRHTRRLHPAICAFTSDIFYEGRLSSLAGLERQRIDAKGPCRLTGAGLRFVRVVHEGNTDESEAEAQAIHALIAELLAAEAHFVNDAGRARLLTHDDILVVAPYNMQVNLLSGRLPGVRVGTVDKFQGKEAPVVFFSPAASTLEDAPRGAGFLLDPSRLNVATSRARALTVIVGSPSLLAARCRTPEQIRLVNALCAFEERAEVVEWGG